MYQMDSVSQAVRNQIVREYGQTHIQTKPYTKGEAKLVANGGVALGAIAFLFGSAGIDDKNTKALLKCMAPNMAFGFSLAAGLFGCYKMITKAINKKSGNKQQNENEHKWDWKEGKAALILSGCLSGCTGLLGVVKTPHNFKNMSKIKTAGVLGAHLFAGTMSVIGLVTGCKMISYEMKNRPKKIKNTQATSTNLLA